jgi:hypothetical protein
MKKTHRFNQSPGAVVRYPRRRIAESGARASSKTLRGAHEFRSNAPNAVGVWRAWIRLGVNLRLGVIVNHGGDEAEGDEPARRDGSPQREAVHRAVSYRRLRNTNRLEPHGLRGERGRVTNNERGFPRRFVSKRNLRIIGQRLVSLITISAVIW